jgi:hypothetical protein
MSMYSVIVLCHVGVPYKFVGAKILLQRWQHDHLPATNSNDDHNRSRLPSYEITRHVNLLSDRFLYVLCHVGVLCKFVAAKIFASALEADNNRSATNFLDVIRIIVGCRVSDRCSLLFHVAQCYREIRYIINVL